MFKFLISIRIELPLTENEYRKLFSQDGSSAARIPDTTSETTSSPDYNWDQLIEEIEELSQGQYTEPPTIEEEEKILEAESYKDVAEHSQTNEFEASFTLAKIRNYSEKIGTNVGNTAFSIQKLPRGNNV